MGMGDGENACFDRRGCQEAWIHILEDPEDVAGAKRIAATYCVQHFEQCSDESEFEADVNLQIAGNLFALLGASSSGWTDTTGASSGANNALTKLFRAVEPNELMDIMETGVYRAAPGEPEGRYFFPTRTQAENFSTMMEKIGGGPYCITSGCIPASRRRGVQSIHPAGEGTAYFVPDEPLALLQ